jgi:hypothetical protein
MRRVVEDPALRERLGARAARTIAERFSNEALGRAAQARLAEIRQLRSQTAVGRLLADSRRRLRQVSRSLASPGGENRIAGPPGARRGRRQATTPSSSQRSRRLR